MQDVVLFAEVLNGAEEALRVLDEGDEDADGDDAAGLRQSMEKRLEDVKLRRLKVVERGDAAAPDDERDGDGAEELDHGVVDGVGEDGVGPGLFVFGVDGGVVVEGPLFTVEELHDGHAGDVLLGEGVDVCGGGALAAVAVANIAAEDLGDVEDGRDDGEGEERERPAHPQHDENDEEENEDVFEDGEYAGGEHLVEGIDVRGDAGDELADRVVIEERGLHALQVAEDLAAQVEHDLLACPLHHVGLGELEDVGEQERAEVEEADLGDAGHGPGAEVPREPGEFCRRCAGHVGVDGDLDEVRAHDVGGGLEEDGEGGEAGLEFVGLEIGEETAHEARVVGLAGDFIVRRRFFCGILLRVFWIFVVGHEQLLF